MPKLPLVLRVRDVRRGDIALEIDAVVEDANGVSVSSESITMGPKTPTSSAMAILQRHVQDIAKGMLARGAVEIPSPTLTKQDDAALIGQSFFGSIIQ